MQILSFILFTLVFISACGDSEIQQRSLKVDASSYTEYLHNLLGYEVPSRVEELKENAREMEDLLIEKKFLVKELSKIDSVNNPLFLQYKEKNRLIDERANILFQERMEVMTKIMKETITELAIYHGITLFCDDLKLPAKREDTLHEILATIDGSSPYFNRRELELQYRKSFLITLNDLESGNLEPECTLMSLFVEELKARVVLSVPRS